MPRTKPEVETGKRQGLTQPPDLVARLLEDRIQDVDQHRRQALPHQVVHYPHAHRSGADDADSLDRLHRRTPALQ